MKARKEGCFTPWKVTVDGKRKGGGHLLLIINVPCDLWLVTNLSVALVSQPPSGDSLSCFPGTGGGAGHSVPQMH